MNIYYIIPTQKQSDSLIDERSTEIAIYRPTYLNIYLPIYLRIFLSTYLSIYVLKERRTILQLPARAGGSTSSYQKGRGPDIPEFLV